MEIESFEFDNILSDWRNIVWEYFSLWHKMWIGEKPLHIRFDKVDGFVRVYDGYRYKVLFCPEK